MVGPEDDILIPRGSAKTDWEVELAVVIGRQARYLASPQEALGCVAGYALANDVSERAFQLEISQHMVLDPGDVINTGTPQGVALSGRFAYLRPGDVVEMEIEGLGRQRSRVVGA